jgi:hypothetical protein
MRSFQYHFFANGDVVAPARSSADFKKDVAAGCHSRLDREKESRMRLKLETRQRLGGTQAHNRTGDSAENLTIDQALAPLGRR